MNKIMNTPTSAGNGDSHALVASPLSVADAAYHTAHKYAGGVGPLALRMGMSHSTLNHKVSMTTATHHLSLEESVLMQQMAQDFTILHSMAASLGHVAIPVQPADDAQPMADVARMVRDFGELLTRVTSAMADGSVTANEMRRCQSDAVAAISAICSVLSTVRSMVPEVRA